MEGPFSTRVFFLPQISVAAQLIKEEGFGSLYRGLSAGLLRQATYTTARLGFYNKISNAAISYNNGQVLPYFPSWSLASRAHAQIT
jgi:hypothetical protein